MVLLSANPEKLTFNEPKSQTSNLPNHVEPTLNKSSFNSTSIPPSNQEDNITDEFEEFLEHFKSDKTTLKQKMLVRKMISYDENILYASISDIKVYDIKLWKTIDSNYKMAFPLGSSFLLYSETLSKPSLKQIQLPQNFY